MRSTSLPSRAFLFRRSDRDAGGAGRSCNEPRNAIINIECALKHAADAPEDIEPQAPFLSNMKSALAFSCRCFLRLARPVSGNQSESASGKGFDAGLCERAWAGLSASGSESLQSRKPRPRGRAWGFRRAACSAGPYETCGSSAKARTGYPKARMTTATTSRNPPAVGTLLPRWWKTRPRQMKPVPKPARSSPDQSQQLDMARAPITRH